MLVFLCVHCVIGITGLSRARCLLYCLSMSVSVHTTLRTPVPKLPFSAIAQDILGSDYMLSATFVGTRRAQSLNQAYRNKSYVPNVLSFPLSSDCGEIFICPAVAAREAKNFSMTPKGYLGFLFIHGCLHLKGYDHGVTMEQAEKKYCTKYAFR